MSDEEKKEVLEKADTLDENEAEAVGGVIESACSAAAAEQIAAKEMSDEEKKEVLEKADTLDENEAEAVTGGNCCACLMGGGGEGDYYTKTCACVAGGGGEWTDDGMIELKKGKKSRCVCVGIGGGDGAR